ncbi:Ubiquitin fusion degradation protein 1 [Escovopsis weberi]|uniref:Ubiquitin fusion degradation protein 1 n=1 Tax=Escovopsis weberi TaxID=150374 RepID=A0A0M8N5R7_ESCWE|nr:Ubiquitin fusion degradation protein 1 [Escovopsis weberi]
MAGYGGGFDLGHTDYLYNMARNSRRPAAQRFDEYYRCYSLIMAPGAERPELDFGSKIILPPSALDKVSKLHVQWPLLMEMINGEKGTHSHAGVLEFIAEEGRAYIPQWMMETLQLDIGDMIQIRTTSLELAKMVKLQPQSVNFLEISDPKAVLEKAFRNFATLTKGDVFNFEYNDERYAVAVLDVKPATDKMGVSMIETDVSVEFAPPVGYVEPTAASAATPASSSTPIPTPAGSMAQAIDYEAIARLATTAPTNFLGEGQRVAKRGSSKNSTPKPATPAPPEAKAAAAAAASRHHAGAPAPLRLPPNQLFFGYEIKPVKTEGDRERERQDAERPHFSGQGQSLRGAVRKKGEGDDKGKAPDKKAPSEGHRLDGRRPG